MKFLLVAALLALFAATLFASTSRDEIYSQIDAIESAKEALLSQLDQDVQYDTEPMSDSGRFPLDRCTNVDGLNVRTDSGSLSRERLGNNTPVKIWVIKKMNGLDYGKIGNNRWVATKYIKMKCSATPAPTSGCALMKYSSDVFQNRVPVIDVQFKPVMDRIVNFARQCNVKLYITSSWRPNSNVRGAIVRPATRSNHMAGHAIDFNISSSCGFCNGDCMARQRNRCAKCFTDKVRADRGMRWGISFNDPVHIDDTLNINNPSAWDSRYYATQQANKNRCY